MNEKESQLVLGTLRVAVADAYRQSEGTTSNAYFASALTALTEDGKPHRASGSIAGLESGSNAEVTFVVAKDDTAAEMGHPDPTMTVLGSPRLALWFELAASELLPKPDHELTHVGVGILVHHLGRAKVGDEVVIRAQLDEIDGRRVVFSLRARVKDRVIALGVHERIVLA